MALTPEQIAQRKGKLTASQVAILMRGKDEDMLNLWREVIGDEHYERPDFEHNWPVQLGVATEKLNLDWFQYKMKVNVIRRGEVITHANGWAACTLDGWVGINDGRPIEAKHVNGFKSFPEVLDYYYPQFTWQAMVTGADGVYASVIMGSSEPLTEFVPYNKQYSDEIMERAEAFMECVREFRPPVILPAPLPPVRPEEYRTVDMNSDASWALAAHMWLMTKEYHDNFQDAREIIKSLVERDVGLAVGHGIKAKRDRGGKIKISLTDEDEDNNDRA